MADDGACRGFEAVPLSLAGTAAARIKGLLFSGPEEGALLLAPCRDVHTVGMRRPIDVAFVDASGRVVESQRGVPPFKRLRCPGAVAVVERFARCDSHWFEKGACIGIAQMERGTK